MTRFDRLVISRKQADHIAERHGLEPREVREAFETGGKAGDVFRGPNSHDGGRTYIVRGRTYAGRPLWVLVKYRGQGMAQLITAHDDR
jgi:hypothetical protein